MPLAFITPCANTLFSLLLSSLFSSHLCNTHSFSQSSSSYCLSPSSLNPNSSATKAALIQMTRDIALDNGSFGIRVNCVAPGPIFTQGGTVQHAKMSNISLVDMCDSLSKDVALRRMGKIKEVAKTVAFLASEDSSYITGSCLQCDGGFFRK